MAESLLSPDFLAKVEQLELFSRKILSGRMRGERRSKRRGFSTEFADHRQYVVGDDLRFIDWNILIRLDRLFIKLFEEEEDLHFHILVDASRSMDFGDPTKLEYAKRVAAALAYVALVNLDRVRVSAFSTDLSPSSPPLRGKKSARQLFDNIAKIEPQSAGNLVQTCRSFALRHPSKGIVVLLSDLLDKSGYEEVLRYLVARQLDIYVIQILSAEEVDPPIVGDLKLVDAEDGDSAEITVSAPLIARYKSNLEKYCQQIRDFCNRRGIAYLFATNHVPFETLVLHQLRHRGLVK